MALALQAVESAETMADLLEQLGGVGPERIRMYPYPGTATVKNVVEIQRQEKRLFELVDGVLVEKVMGFTELRLAVAIAAALEKYIEADDLGVVAGPDGMIRLPANLVRMPDVAFIPWNEFPHGEVTADPVPEVVPSLAVEVLSKGNTAGEMSRKLREYFAAGVRLVWFIDPQTRTALVYTSASKCKRIPAEGTLDGGKVLPGFRLSLPTLFAKLKQSRRHKRNGR